MARSNQSTAPSTSWLLSIIVGGGVITALYWARDVLVPFALAILLSFLLTPAVAWLERRTLRRFPAVILVTGLFLSIAIGLGWMVANQLVDLMTQLPEYRANIHKKMESLSARPSLGKFMESVRVVAGELSHPWSALNQKKSGTTSRPIPVEIVQSPSSILQSLRDLLGPLLGPLATVVIVITFTVFMLLQREDLLDRLLRLVGPRQLNVTTQAIEDAAQRLSRYLLMQLFVNMVYGLLFAIGLYFIGVPNAMLWGVLATVLRFVPYIGTWLCAAMPITLSLVIFEGWARPLLAVGLFLAIELTIANMVEPWLYGSHTGITSLAILVAAIFWAALWGPVGLVLSTPLTVCLVVLGRYVPQLGFLNVLLGDEPVLAPEARLYQRLLAMDPEGADKVIEECLQGKSLLDVYDSLIIPTLILVARDQQRGALDPARSQFIYESIREMVEDLAERFMGSWAMSDTANGPIADPASRPMLDTRLSNISIVCLPIRDELDELVCMMLTQLLEQRGYHAVDLASGLLVSEILDQVAQQRADLVCLSALSPFAGVHTRYLCRRLRTGFPDLKIIAALWSATGGAAKVSARIKTDCQGEAVTTLAQALEHIRQLAEPMLLTMKK